MNDGNSKAKIYMDQEAMDALTEAGQLYERYVELARIGQSLSPDPLPSQNYSWDHPLTLVIRSETDK